jgi:hypothetical protein
MERSCSNAWLIPGIVVERMSRLRIVSEIGGTTRMLAFNTSLELPYREAV